MSWFVIQDLLSYWADYPPVHIIGRHFAQHFRVYSVPEDPTVPKQYASKAQLEAFAAQLG